ncbi:hypothetical protein BMS3Abin03_01696 [bacterium BMS3Abin03]|nr:hypothetical protein BMS3Abin03_01696 [bacterium BMS3Abin03]
MPLTLTRPLVFFDLETTGTDFQNDRIIEFSKEYEKGERLRTS